ncbi:MAG TPA: BadF/BadG/BcrA/BcrD ATPase family protein [Gaiellales bacterium]|nr:BadF/BadG/BcrA/BcrD ATPase family protein [Gaiellales bacterium]
MTVVLGVDGGGSKTHAAVCDETGNLIGSGTAGPANWETVGLRGAADSIGDAIDRALAGTDIRRRDLETSVFGLAGVDWPSDVTRLDAAFEQLALGGPPVLLNDSFIALRAGVTAPWGVVVIAGTGTVAAGRNREGRTARTLGLGRVLGDEGSASDVSEAALRAVARAYTGRGPATSLSEGLCQVRGASSVVQLLEEYSRGGEPEFNAAPLVLAHAARGDAVAAGIVEWAGSELGAAAATVARTLDMLEEPFELVLAGGLFHGASDMLEKAISREVPTALLTRLEAPPVAGALLAALEHRGDRPTAEVRDRLGRSLLQAFR